MADDPTELTGHENIPRPPKRIGRYTLRRVIAAGGMGTVYEAIQEHPRRTVAVKLMNSGIASPEALRRFEFESQILARLRHPAIAEVYEAGTHDSGRGPVPYFAMEYVPNALNIAAFAATRKLGLEERLRLFAAVCDGVHHGHQKGIIHRDLKPDNLIVDPEGRPKIIDFGVARATDSDLAVATLQTEYGQLLGTLQYMSPEQIQGDPGDIDIRADVYSLGIILYELLSGKRPYDLTGVPAIEAARRIRDDTPTRITSIDRRLVGDPATIVHKAMEKDRDRRYQSAGALAEDIRHYLNREPITARPPTPAYQMRVFARKNRALVVSVAAVFIVLLAGVCTSTILYARAEAQRAAAEKQRHETLSALSYLDDLMNSTDPSGVGTEVKISDLLDRYSRKVGTAFPDAPEIEAAVRTSIGRAYQKLNLYEKAGQGEAYQRAAREQMRKALQLRQEALGPRHPETIEAMLSLADLLQSQGQFRDAEQLFRQVWKIRGEQLGARDSETVEAKIGLASVLQDRKQYELAETLTREAVEVYKRNLGESHPRTIEALAGLSQLRCMQGDFTGSERICRQVIRLRGPQDGASPSANDYGIRNLSSALLAQGRIRESEELYGDQQVPPLAVRKWLQGRVDPTNGSPTMLVAWEVWCPYSRAVMQRLQEIRDEYGPRGLQMACLTSSSKEERVTKYLEREHVVVPMAIIGDDVTSFYDFTGVPQAAIVAGGNIVWKGHPDFLTPEVIAGLLGTR